MLLLLLLHLKDDTKTCITLDNIESLLRFIVFMFVFSFHIYLYVTHTYFVFSFILCLQIFFCSIILFQFQKLPPNLKSISFFLHFFGTIQYTVHNVVILHIALYYLCIYRRGLNYFAVFLNFDSFDRCFNSVIQLFFHTIFHESYNKCLKRSLNVSIDPDIKYTRTWCFQSGLLYVCRIFHTHFMLPFIVY